MREGNDVHRAVRERLTRESADVTFAGGRVVQRLADDHRADRYGHGENKSIIVVDMFTDEIHPTGCEGAQRRFVLREFVAVGSQQIGLELLERCGCL